MSDDWAGPIELATHAAALIEAIRTGRAVPAGRLFGLPELPGDDYWLDMAGATAVTGIPPKTITSWLARGRPAPATPSPRRNDSSTGCTGAERRSRRGRPERKPQPVREHRPDQVSPQLRGTYRTHSGLAGRTPLCHPSSCTSTHGLARRSAQLSGGPPRARGHVLCLAIECPCEFPRYFGIDTAPAGYRRARSAAYGRSSALMARRSSMAL